MISHQPELYAMIIIFLCLIFIMVFLQMKHYKKLDAFELFIGTVISFFISIIVSMQYKLVFIFTLIAIVITGIILFFKYISKIILLNLPVKEENTND